MQLPQLYEIIKRWHHGQDLSDISRNTGKARKTLRKYIQKAEAAGICKDEALPDKNAMLSILKPLLEKRKVANPAKAVLLEYKQEVIDLMQDKEHPVKAKTAFEIITERYGLSVSYTSFKRFAREMDLKQLGKKISYPMPEIEPGLVTELDYGQVGRHHDGIKNRNVYAFTGVLVHSRLPYIEFVHSQESESWVTSNASMVEFYGGTTERFVTDNLKSSVIKADKFDPELNRAYADFAEHYGVFLDPARAYHPQDKPKVERMVPLARELFRKLRHLYPDATLQELNRKAQVWCRDDYGMRVHGTTGKKPCEVFLEVEQKALKPLPAEAFVVSVWKDAKVHPDQFIQFEKKRYSLPSKYVGLKVQVKRVKSLVTIYHDHKKIRQYTVPRDGIALTPGDLPEHSETILNEGYPGFILSKARELGEPVVQVIEQMLSSSHAYLNLRNAQAMIKELEKHKDRPYFEILCRRALDARCQRVKHLKGILAMLESQMRETVSDIPMSELGQRMVRDTRYLFKD